MARVALAVTTVLVLAAQSLATPVIVVGNHPLQPNQTGQEILIYVSGGDAVQGLNCLVQVADGGPAMGGSIVGPTISNLDIVTGTIFQGNSYPEVDQDGPYPDPYPQWEEHDTITKTGSVSADGLLATVTLDTTGFFSGTWGLYLANASGGPTDFAGLAADITDGTIWIESSGAVVPEPATLLLFSLGVAAAAWRRRASARV